jgi:hypothetical protein
MGSICRLAGCFHGNMPSYRACSRTCRRPCCIYSVATEYRDSTDSVATEYRDSTDRYCCFRVVSAAMFPANDNELLKSAS